MASVEKRRASVIALRRRIASAPKVLGADALLGALAIAVGLASLWFPFGRDQGLFYYVGREWFERGAIPYRDVWDHKTPLIYVVHAAAVAAFGPGMWPIRLVELLLMPVIGWLAAGVATPIGERRFPGAVGVAWLMATLGYQGCLIFWDTAQCEVWAGTFALAGACAALRIRTVRRAAFWAGALASISFWFKPPAVFFAVLVFSLIVRRARHWMVLGAFCLGFLGFSTLIVGYFGVYGALPQMYEIVVGANAYYVEHEQTEPGLRDFLLEHVLLHIYGPLLIAPVLGSIGAAAWALITRRGAVARRYGLFLALVCAAGAAVFVQMKMYFYHWGCLVAALAYVGAVAHRDVVLLVKRRTGEAAALGVGAGLCAAIAFSLFAATPSSVGWRDSSVVTFPGGRRASTSRVRSTCHI